MINHLSALLLASVLLTRISDAAEPRRLNIDVDPKGSYRRFEAYGFSYKELVEIVEITSKVKVEITIVPDDGMDVLLEASEAETVLRLLFEHMGYSVEKRGPRLFYVLKPSSVQ